MKIPSRFLFLLSMRSGRIIGGVHRFRQPQSYSECSPAGGTGVDRQQWNKRRAAEPPLSPELQQMFTLARRMGYEMRPIARRLDAPRQTPGPQSSPNKEYRAPFRPRDYSRTKCFSCGQLGHTQVHSSLPFRPDGWVDRSDGPQRRNGGSPQGNEI